MSVGLELFERLVVVGNCLESLRDSYEPCSDAWLMSTELLGLLDEAIDLLVESRGIDDEEEEV